MNFNQRLALCWMMTVAFAIAAFFRSMSPQSNDGLVIALCSATFVIVHGLGWYQLVVWMQAEHMKAGSEAQACRGFAIDGDSEGIASSK